MQEQLADVSIVVARPASGVESVDCYCVDNLLARVGDPLFLGYCHSQGWYVGMHVCCMLCNVRKM